MAQEVPTDEWIEAANCLATVAHQLSSAMHEANNLLQVIAGSAEMIQFKSGLSDDIRKRTEVISEHAHRVSTLLGGARDLAKFSPRQAGQATDVRAVVVRALELRKHALGRAQVKVSTDIGDVPRAVMLNARPALQVVLNLLLNAEQALRGRQNATIAVSLSRENHDVVLTIADNGPGLTEDSPNRFALCLDPDASPRLGLGLSAAQWMCQRDGGQLDVRSRQGGTVATLRLPAAD